ncbi:protein TPR3-like isoform X1 [Senna tora]|uniref:Protein TPR3-like isoform X1 n=1 Tax=Senna tora TaxID=362788 RepID=A0A834U1K9_9FABA|nr:protein TPR3-like isoform X1 [Senna tora]
MANQPFVLNNLDDVLLACSLYHLMDRNYVKTAHTLEEESGIYFNMQYFEELIMDGRYEDAEFYVLGFTCVSDNENSAKIIFDIKKLKLLEALDDGCNFWAEYMVDTEFGQFKERNEKMYDEAVEVVSDDGAKWKKGLVFYVSIYFSFPAYLMFYFVAVIPVILHEDDVSLQRRLTPKTTSVLVGPSCRTLKFAMDASKY